MLPTLLVFASAIALVSSQSTATIDPGSVPLSTRRESRARGKKQLEHTDHLPEAWCNSQVSSCPLLCLQMPGVSGSPIANNCSAVSEKCYAKNIQNMVARRRTDVFLQQTLAYSCVCSNNASPNSSEYSETLPYYVCTEANNQCVKKCSNSVCQNACRADHPCGAQNPDRVNLTTTSTAAATSTTMASILTTSTATGVASQMFSVDKAHVYGLCVLVGGFIGGFSMLL
ncbi:uncharacterized protein N7459_002200 [Penicillium hispanicum]|uniref:uncharacterized protein n=1 Tax=Penicillium hispanicum TaxID=1080232 RepID=UPI00253FEEDC|nr:uncharacterized protein N7459_002200 [Penicillium hispanicum]KAJ5591831.1 hypothetical protein N7459_002200 [Penicillium hispanicum]